MYKRNMLQNDSAILNLTMDTLYDGVIAINKEGYITMIGKGYAKVFEKKKEEIVGKHITEIVEETRLPIVVKTGQAEIGELFKINDQYLVVSRIPITKNGEVIGAIAKIVFNSISDLNSIYENVSKMKRQLQGSNNNISALNRTTYSFDDIIGEGELIKNAKKFARKAAACSSNILILGESGTGKELFAHAIHKESRRKYGAFIKVNCGAIPGELLESELFGYEGGSFTGAKKEGKIGKFELADGGTIFLDEIGDMPTYMQVKLLRVLQEKEVEKIGSAGPKKIDVRVIAATNQNLEQLVKEGKFRKDLFYRLNVLTINIPSLKERREDIETIVYHLINKISNKVYKYIYGISSEALEYIKGYSWPGNIRELENVLERAITIIENETVIHTKHLPDKITAISVCKPVRNLQDILNDAEKEAILNSIIAAKGNKSKAAQLLGISRSNLYEKMGKLHID
ncbi:sigma 54-interacting transcriptional regulator [Clostridium sp. PL3]|uniref:Sigma 54-interacting transcriptional regulator n=1 Tax=Clostridium thailandense TaxID=2794346 RepID=A0A949U3F8_9CLOT|nr:sigma 54-interacting transcriptional regulator [Clostridium thailandense]MBV7275728.1 sigma 54-interacting transcriptional regulator [Clostridium thailandense]